VLLRSVVALLAVAFCLLAMQAAGRFGFARLLGKYAVATNSIPAADQAIALAPADAEVHRARARVMNRLKNPAEARKSFEVASSLRYRDDYLWLELGSTRDELGDAPAALAAFEQAVRWAPHYAHTLWQRGNLKLRMGRYDEAFADLRAAAASKKTLMPSLIDMTWGLTRGNPNTAEQLLQINNDSDRLAFAKFLARKGRGKECLEQLRLIATPLSEENRRAMVQQLIAAKAFHDAFALWRTDSTPKSPVIENGGFEEPVELPGTDQGFGWYIVGKPEPKIVRDGSEKLSGRTSLLLGFNGEWKAPADTILQRIVVEPQRRYRISFGVRTKELVTGAPPALVVTDASSEQRLGQSQPFPAPTNNWQTMSFEFDTAPATQAIVLAFTRVEGPCNPCPIFGEFWVDDFLIEDVTTVNPQH